ncbi:MAG: hypothetical protein AAB209_10490, partial [Bacteroidota bacterium]
MKKIAWFLGTLFAAVPFVVSTFVDYSTAGSAESMNLSSIRIGQPFRIYPSTVTQTEPFITRHPTNPNILFVSANTI